MASNEVKDKNDSDQPAWNNLREIIAIFQRDAQRNYLAPCKEHGVQPKGLAMIYRISTNAVIAVNDLAEFLQAEDIPTSDMLKLTWFHDGKWEMFPAAIEKVQRLWPTQAPHQGVRKDWN